LDEYLKKDDQLLTKVAVIRRTNDSLESCFASVYDVNTYTNDPGFWLDTADLEESQTFCGFYTSFDDFISVFLHFDTYEVEVLNDTEWARIK